MQTILIAAGGTGGHIFPALAIAKELKKKYHIIWLGSENGMENTLVKEYSVFNVHAVGVRGKSIKTLMLTPFKILFAILQTKKIIKQNKVGLVLCMGGFVGGVGGLATLLSKTKLVIHEQNSIAGTSNRWLNRFSNQSFQAFDGALKNAITCGNPINFRKIEKKPISNPINILVLGGSLGAKKLNDIIPQLKLDVQIIHQVGKKNLSDIKNKYNTDNYKIIDFIDNMTEAYANADLIVARSGAMTISEIIYTKTPAILIPFPFAIDNHQFFNAKILENRNCGIIIEEEHLTVEKLEITIKNLTIEKLTTMQGNFGQFSKNNPIQTISNYITKIY